MLAMLSLARELGLKIMTGAGGTGKRGPGA